ncbi:MAG: acetyl-CoA C-acyltransferase [Flavipsychrobacter sp.]|nr:acetyl-CoA C-acyltransferase [Flavipsychrobacter sp.]
MKTAYVIDAIRTPIGKYGGSLSSVRPDDLLAHVIKTIIARNPKVDVNAIEDVIAGAANQAGEDNRDVARMSALLAGLPITVGGNTVNRLCGSGMQAIMDAARAIMCGDGEIFIAGGVESMSRAPFVMGKATTAFARQPEMFDTTLGWRFINQKLSDLHHPYTMGETAENVAERWNVTREEQDQFAWNSQEKYAAAAAEGKFTEEIAPVTVDLGKGKTTVVSVDEPPRQTPLSKLAELKPVFKKNGTVTAANASGINDGASVLLLASEDAVAKYGLQPIAKIKAMAIAGVDPSIMGVGPVPASLKALSRAGLQMNDIDLVELNEAFAAQSIACMRDLGLQAAKVNVNGGAIAIGHPLGCSGARISTTLLYEMRRRKAKYGLATMCIGVGQGVAIIYERV